MLLQQNKYLEGCKNSRLLVVDDYWSNLVAVFSSKHSTSALHPDILPEERNQHNLQHTQLAVARVWCH